MKVILDYDSKANKGIIFSDMIENIRTHFSVPNKMARFLQRMYDNNHIPSRHYAITATGRFEIGLFQEICKYLTASEVGYEIEVTQTMQDKIKSDVNLEDFVMPTFSLTPYDYQEESLMEGLELGNGIFLIGTGGGKTLLMAMLAQSQLRLGKKNVIILLPAHLVLQTYKDFIGYGVFTDHICLWTGDTELEMKPIIITSYNLLQTKVSSFKQMDCKDFTQKEEHTEKEKSRLAAWKKRKKDYIAKLKDIDVVILDEAHVLRKENKLNHTISIFNTPNKFGFTGTLPESKLDQWNLIGKIGPIITEISSHQLRKEGYLTNVKAQIIKINYKNPVKANPSSSSPTKAWDEECEFIYEQPYRTKVIKHFAGKFQNNALILVDRIKHGEFLYNMLKESFPEKRVYWIRGDVKMVDREKLRALMETEDNIICIAIARIFSVGININNLHFIMLALNGKAKVTLIQTIGRGLRLHKTKDKLFIIDLADELYYGSKHLAERIGHYEKEKIAYEIESIHE